MPVSQIDLLDLAKKLKREKLFVANERKEIEGLNRKVIYIRFTMTTIFIIMFMFVSFDDMDI